MRGFFGGDLSVAHFTVHVPYGSNERAQRAKLKELGFKTRYFQFKVNDEKAKARAKAQAEASRLEWEARAGFELEVSEGCFL